MSQNDHFSLNLLNLLLITNVICCTNATAAETLPTADQPIDNILPNVTVEADREDLNTPYEHLWEDPDFSRYSVPDAATSTKTNTPIMETPFSIQVIPQQVLKDQQTYRVQDVIKNVSGLRETSTYQPAYEGLLARGFEAKLFRDGVRTEYLTIPIANAEQVEVFKGPGAVLYGRMEPGGMVNVVTKKPLSTPYYSLEQRFGSYDFYRTAIDATGPVNADQSLLYRFNLEYLNTGSFRDYIGEKRIFLAPSLTWKLSDRTQFDLSFEYRDNAAVSSVFTGIPAIGDRPARGVPLSSFFGEPGLQDNFEVFGVYFKGQHQVNDDWTLRFGASTWQGNYIYQCVCFSGLNPDNRTLSRFLLVSDNDVRNTYDAYFDVVGHFETYGLEHQVLVGTDYHIFENTADWYGDNKGKFPLKPFDIFKPTYTGVNVNLLMAQRPDAYWLKTDEWNGVYFQDQITLMDNVHILGGGRYDFARGSTAFTDIGMAAAEASRSPTSDERFSPRVGLVYQPLEWLSVYGSYVESFGLNNGQPAPGEQAFAPEVGKQYETGLKFQSLDGHLLANLAFYHLTKNNQLIDAIDTPDPNDQRALGKARSQGIEFDVSGKLTDSLSLIGTYAFTDAKVIEDAQQFLDANGNLVTTNGNEGRKLANVPQHQGSLWLTYEFQQDLLRGLKIGGGVYLASEVQGVLTPNPQDLFQLPGYARLDASISYGWKLGKSRVTTQVNINNFLDKAYYAAAAGRSDIVPAEPLTVLGSIRIEY